MPIKIPNDLPASKILRAENIFVMDENRALSQEIRPLQLLILNIMPTKIVTETQLLRMLSNTPLQIEVDWIHMASHESKNTSQEHLLAFYKTFDDIKEKNYDGLIITGAPVERLKFEDVDYWPEMEKILEWAKTHVFSSFFICWSSQAALYYYYGIPKYELEEKLTGVYFHYTNIDKMKRKILRGFDYQFYAPHSRYTTVLAKDIDQVPTLDILAQSQEAGVYLIAETDGSRFFVTGHPEYDPDTLDKEYRRDLAISKDATMPKNYYRNDDINNEILVKWRSHAYLLFSNWLNYYVYQQTPYDLNDLESIKMGKKD
ncbi:homoserine O-succinyltransferase [uncultured Thomasclavelia sp.]|uniref:homoserine O-acetyltransferase MetA n=1 Tax=uncultured Thomasclavelia sp. TaxID=3025759 RepID=UPI0025FE2771|nr:homoserine O-succinyltransferase [uncultured Thomasclavelia sp.]